MLTKALLFLTFFMVLNVGLHSVLGKNGEEIRLNHAHDDNKLSLTEEEHTLNKEKAVVFKNNREGFTKYGSESFVTGHKLKFTIQKYIKAGTKPGLRCFKLVTISREKDNEPLDQVKISCEYDTQQPSGSSIPIDTIIFEPFPFEVVYVIRGHVCIHRYYDMEEPNNIKKVDVLIRVNECDKLWRRSNEERDGGNLLGDEPLQPADLAVMDKQIVVLLKGNIKGFSAQKSYPPITTKNFQVNIQELIHDKNCIKFVTITRKDLLGVFDQVIIPCKVNKPIITNDEDIVLNFGNIIYILDLKTVVFVTKNSVCVQRSYQFHEGRVQHKVDSELSPADCYQITRWRWNERNCHDKLNQQPPHKSVSAPGKMWLLSMSADTKSYSNGRSAILTAGNGAVFLDSQDFYKGYEECIRVLTIKLKGVEVEQLAASCGPQELNVNTHGTHYGKAFVLDSELGTNKFIGIYNVKRDGSCLKIIYDITSGGSGKYTKSKPQTVTNEDCTNLSPENSITRRSSSKKIQDSKKGHALGWFGGFFKKLFTSAWR